jgi:hypothetical protein
MITMFTEIVAEKVVGRAQGEPTAESQPEIEVEIKSRRKCVDGSCKPVKIDTMWSLITERFDLGNFRSQIYADFQVSKFGGPDYAQRFTSLTLELIPSAEASYQRVGLNLLVEITIDISVSALRDPDRELVVTTQRPRDDMVICHLRRMVPAACINAPFQIILRHIPKMYFSTIPAFFCFEGPDALLASKILFIDLRFLRGIRRVKTIHQAFVAKRASALMASESHIYNIAHQQGGGIAICRRTTASCTT